jgi:hypothetical protein
MRLAINLAKDVVGEWLLATTRLRRVSHDFIDPGHSYRSARSRHNFDQ